MLPDVPETTVDTLEGLSLTVLQPVRGYRFAVDALLLAFFASRFEPVSFVDVGAGCGICSLALMRHSNRSRRVTLFEIQPGLARCARHNMHANAGRHVDWSVRTEDARYAVVREPVDLVMANPPYRRPEDGRVSPIPQRALARHGYRLSGSAMAQASFRMLTPEGTVCIVLPPGEVNNWVHAFQEAGLSVRTRCAVLSAIGGGNILTLLAFGRSDEADEMEPVVLRDRSGNYTPTARFIMGIV